MRPQTPASLPIRHPLNLDGNLQLQLLDRSASSLIQIDTTNMTIGAHNAAAETTFGPTMQGKVCHQRLMQSEERCKICRALEAYVTNTETSATVQISENKWLKVSWIPAKDLPGRSVVETITDITAEMLERNKFADQTKQLEEQATTDSMTKLMNRNAWYRFAEEHAKRAWEERQPIELLIVDIDHFKSINDTYGHGVGDKAIIHLAMLMRQTMRQTDFIGRYGGEEFVILLNPTTTNPKELAEQLRIAVETTPLVVDEVSHPIKMTVSIGMASRLLEPLSGAVDSLTKDADRALYASKHSGRNRSTHADDLEAGSVESMQELSWIGRLAKKLVGSGLGRRRSRQHSRSH